MEEVTAFFGINNRPIYVADTSICNGYVCKKNLQEAIDECPDYGVICILVVYIQLLRK